MQKSVGQTILPVSLLGILALVGIFLVFLLDAKRAPTGDIAKGAPLYAEFCAPCHGANLKGEADWQTPNDDGSLRAPPHDHTGHTWHHGDGMLFDYVKKGGQAILKEMGIEGVKSAMPGFGDTLTDIDIANVLMFIKSNWSDKERDYQKLRTQEEELSTSDK